jgi:epoxide hydrolase
VNDVITPFRIDLSEAAIDDLRERLRRVRWPEPATVSGWSQGTPLAWRLRGCARWGACDCGAAHRTGARW